MVATRSPSPLQSMSRNRYSTVSKLVITRLANLARRHAAYIALSLLTGVLTTIIIAWYCALFVSQPRQLLEYPSWMTPLLGPFVQADPSIFDGEVEARDWQAIDGFGWPLVALRSDFTIRHDLKPDHFGYLLSDFRLSGGVLLQRSGSSYCVFRAIPLIPHPLGFTVNSLIAIVLITSIVQIYRYHHDRRCRAQNTCRTCGYSLRGSRGDLCTECGTSRLLKRQGTPRLLRVLCLLHFAAAGVILGYAATQRFTYPTFYSAVIAGEEEVVASLLASGSNPNAPADDDAGPCSPSMMEDIRPLFAAARLGNLEIVNLLVNAGADVSGLNCGLTPLAISVSQGHLEVVERLAAAGADLDGASGQANSPLEVAIMCEQLQLVDWLLRNGADVNSRSSGGGVPLMAVVAGGDEQRRVVLMDELIEYGADVNAVDNGGYSVLMTATRDSRLNILRCLLDHGADVNYVRLQGEASRCTALHLAVKNRDVVAARMLLEHGADPDLRRSDGPSARDVGHAEGIGVVFDEARDP